jgi:hypothetical protein
MMGVEIGLMGAAAALILLYGLGQRYRHKKILQQISLERTKLENDAERIGSSLISKREDFSYLEGQVSKLKAERDALKEEKSELDAYLESKDNRRSIQKAKDELAALEERLSLTRKYVEGYTVASVSTSKDQACFPAYSTLISEAAQVWSVRPGLKLRIRASSSGPGAKGCTEWSGSTMQSLKDCVERVKKTHIFNGNYNRLNLEVDPS